MTCARICGRAGQGSGQARAVRGPVANPCTTRGKVDHFALGRRFDRCSVCFAMVVDGCNNRARWGPV
eukprot:14701472-Alexandrium_andersonii.AAC.1